ncbi:type II toxin-antitoxin system RelE/ParE family toxin [Pseudodesulfovibrio sp. S3]|nr:type II toxin-antitoxin system RelE/ParE family toxin [Pseudodesulfovibrio sp. S3]
MTRIKWTPNALQDLDRVRVYLAESAGEDVVLSEAQRIWDGCQRLKEFPESGRPGRVPMTREVLALPYIIPYRIKDDCVEILNIFHSAQKR